MIKLYDTIQGGSNVEEFEINDYSKKFGISQRLFDNLKHIGDFKTEEGLKLLSSLLKSHGISADRNYLKKISHVLYDLRIFTKKNNKELLNFIDQNGFKYQSIIYFLILLGFSNSKQHGFNSKNSIPQFFSILENILDSDHVKIKSLLCAHRERRKARPERRNYLAEKLNKVTINRLINCLDGIFDGIKKKYTLDLYQPGGDRHGISSVFPTIFMKYFIKGDLYNLRRKLNSQIDELQEILPREYINVQSTTLICKEATSFLNSLYGNSWSDINLYKHKSDNKFSEIAYYMTREEIGKIVAKYSELRKSKQEMSKLIDFNTSGLSQDLKKRIELAIEDVLNKNSINAKSTFETAFYYTWGKVCKDAKAIGIGLDRDHNLFQTRSFGLGYSGDFNNPNYPLVYARRTRNVNQMKLQNISFRQFWYYDGLYNKSQ